MTVSRRTHCLPLLCTCCQVLLEFCYQELRRTVERLPASLRCLAHALRMSATCCEPCTLLFTNIYSPGAQIQHEMFSSRFCSLCCTQSSSHFYLSPWHRLSCLSALLFLLICLLHCSWFFRDVVLHRWFSLFFFLRLHDLLPLWLFFFLLQNRKIELCTVSLSMSCWLFFTVFACGCYVQEAFGAIKSFAFVK